MASAVCERCSGAIRMDHWRFCPACGLRLKATPRQPGVRVRSGWSTFCWQCGHPDHGGRCGPDREGEVPLAR